MCWSSTKLAPDKADISEELRVLRCLLLLIKLTGKCFPIAAGRSTQREPFTAKKRQAMCMSVRITRSDIAIMCGRHTQCLKAGAGPYVGQHLPSIMVLLSSSVRQSNAEPLKLQALEGWQALVQALAKEAPHQLADVANQVCQHPASTRLQLLASLCTLRGKLSINSAPDLRIGNHLMSVMNEIIKAVASQ